MDKISSVNEAISRLSVLEKDIHDILQDEFFDYLAYSKQTKIRQKLEKYDSLNIRTVYLGEHLKNAMPINVNREYINLPADFLDSPPVDIPKHSLFLLTNNDIGPRLADYIKFYSETSDALFVIWDWDSQHWVHMSSMLALNSDFYIPASSENTFLLSHFSPYVVGPVFIGVHQWTRKFLVENINLLLESRSNEPFGPHAFYGGYPRRNRVVATVSKVYPTVNFRNNDYKVKSDYENLHEWAKHKTHWIAPVLGGVPIRVFNALITGGIPILPSFYKNLPEVFVLGNSPLYYETSDLLEPTSINEAAVAKFDHDGESGLIGRITSAIATHHVDHHCEYIFHSIEDCISRIVSNDRGFDSERRPCNFS